MAEMISCWRCDQVKPDTEFYRFNGKVRRPCKECRKAEERTRRRDHPERVREIDRKRAPKKGLKRRDTEYRRRYGITLAQYEDTVMTQCGTCALCGGEPNGRHEEKRLHVHHSHRTGKFVALVCSECNLGMGKFHDDPALLRRAADMNE